MKYLLTLLSCFVATHTFASSADSGRCPWKIPFTIAISGNGQAIVNTRWKLGIHDAQHDTAYYSNYADSAEILVDTANAYKNDSVQYSLHDDTLRFFRSYIDVGDTVRGLFPRAYDSVVICFELNSDSISSMTVVKFASLVIPNSAWNSPELESWSYTFYITSVAFDNQSIIAADTSLPLHGVVFQATELDSSEFPSSDEYNFVSTNDFTASSVTLSGIFRATTFSNPAAVEHARPPGSLDIHASNGSIACSFDISDHARELEIYSPLGIRVASIAIPPEESHAALPLLQPGFYFVRLDGDVRKLLVGQ